ncbi:DUF1684 domain-containing protein [Streptomyces sp. NPDC005648]|uniref:DUF1684 domain-containing protein n=1 Tax=Streptomyces sp. NPDC005648 TaxID=3157044 RepID=UPI0033AF7B24
MAIDEAFEWKQWHERRVESVSAPYGPLALTGTYWFEDHPDGRLPDIPGIWTPESDGVTLTAVAADGLTVDGEPLDGAVRLEADAGAVDAARVAYGERRLVVLVREGVWGVRDFDPAAEARRAFRGIDATPYDPRWSVRGRFTPYGEDRVVRVENADGRERGLGLAGELAFAVQGRELTLQVAAQGDVLWAVFADRGSGEGGGENGGSGRGSYRFRFLYPAAPDDEGWTTVDFNRAQLPPCAFADHFICPFPPPGNTLDLAIEAGERNLA